ncbi:MAG: alpha-1,2-fucosyltransferase [Selenomonadaceae bacterium]|nr:alpha-1,2-fucosyltransferase [Selenomonadaceae bacterium]
MFIVKFMAGLGNQMYQYAFYRLLETLFPHAHIYADITPFRRDDSHWGYELERVFGIHVREANDDDITRLTGIRPKKRKILNTIYKLYLLITRHNVQITPNVFCSVDWPLIDIQEKMKSISDSEDIYFDGYWQYPSLFAPVNHLLRQEFVFRYKTNHKLQGLIADMEKTESVAVHVRRGDYVGTAFECIGMQYYHKAINILETKVENPFFYIFSDDESYIKQEFSFLKNKFFVTGNERKNSYLDMMLMSRCKHNIIANSSFSYWGAHLNQHENKIVVTPLNDIGFRSLVDDGWIVL